MTKVKCGGRDMSEALKGIPTEQIFEAIEAWRKVDCRRTFFGSARQQNKSLHGKIWEMAWEIARLRMEASK